MKSKTTKKIQMKPRTKLVMMDKTPDKTESKKVKMHEKKKGMKS